MSYNLLSIGDRQLEPESPCAVDRCESCYLEVYEYEIDACEAGECTCGKMTCKPCVKVCDGCGEYIGCKHCMFENGESEWFCDECIGDNP